MCNQIRHVSNSDTFSRMQLSVQSSTHHNTHKQARILLSVDKTKPSVTSAVLLPVRYVYNDLQDCGGKRGVLGLYRDCAAVWERCQVKPFVGFGATFGGSGGSTVVRFPTITKSRGIYKIFLLHCQTSLVL